MSKSVFVVLATCGLVAGCVTVSAPSPTPSATLPVTTQAPTPTFGPSPTPGPATVPTGTPTSAPTTAPTGAPTTAPTATAEPTSDLVFDARDVLFDDDFDDAASGWGVGEVSGADGSHIGSVGYVDESLEIAIDNQDGWIWSPRSVGSSHATMRVAGEFTPGSNSRFGLFCASGSELYGAVVGTDGGWAFSHISGDGMETLLEDAGAGLDVPVDDSTLVAVECAGMATNSLRMTLWLGDYGPVAMYEAFEGPDNFDRSAAYAEALGDSTVVDVQQVIAFGSGFADNQVTDAAADLLNHVPEGWLDRCYQSVRPPYPGGTAEAVVMCFIRWPGDEGAEIVEYSSYLSTDAMAAAYAERIDVFGTGEGAGSCESGPGEQGYTIGGVDAGRLLCVEQFRGVRFDWTETRLNIMSSLVDFDGDFGKTWDDWLAAGPNV